MDGGRWKRHETCQADHSPFPFPSTQEVKKTETDANSGIKRFQKRHEMCHRRKAFVDELMEEGWTGERTQIRKLGAGLANT